MARLMVIATAGAGGDLQPLVAAALALRKRGHQTMFVGDSSVERSLAPFSVDVSVLPAEVDLGPRLVAAIREAMGATGGDLAAAGPIVRERLTGWAREVATSLADLLPQQRPAAIVTSLFGVEVLTELAPSLPWAVVNSTFYVGPNPPRALNEDFAPRAVPLIENFASLLGSASLVLHATDRIFDFSFDGLPPSHRYVGPLGIWEPPGSSPAYLDEPGDPWVLVSISSQMQDDVPLAEAALAALADHAVRVVVTVGPDHDPAELSRVPANARVERVIAHSAVLRRGALLVSHAGHGSVMKALWHGRPMVLAPWGRDQPGVAARAAALGVAEIVPREHASPEGLGEAISKVLSSARMREEAEGHAARLHATDPAETAAKALEALL